MRDLTYGMAIANAERLLAEGHDTVYIDPDGAPWNKADRVEVGDMCRFNSPVNFYVVACERGLTLKWLVEMESRAADGRDAYWFDRDRLREVALKLPHSARTSLASLLVKKVLPDVQRQTSKMRQKLNIQLDSEECIRGLIASANTESVNVA